MTSREEMESYLRGEPRGRERLNKNRAIVNVLLKRFPALTEVPKETLTYFITEAATLDRAWRKTLEECPDLRGSDYGDKDELEREKQQELGYNV